MPRRVLDALGQPTIDHRGPNAAAAIRRVLGGLRQVLGTRGDVIVYPSSGTGGWEAALVNTLSLGDRVLFVGAGHFVTLWSRMAEQLGFAAEMIDEDIRRGADPERVHAALAADRYHSIAAVCVVHNETSSGVMSRLEAIRPAIDAASHPALLLVDAISSAGSVEFRHDAWGIDVTVVGSQKGLMLPPGIGINVVSQRALDANQRASAPRAYWDWKAHIEANAAGGFPYTPPTNMLVALDVALEMLLTEGIATIAARHRRHAAATRAAVWAWGLDIVGTDEREHSPTLTAVLLDDSKADAVRNTALRTYNMSLGAGLGPLAGKVFRIGHLAHLGDLELIATLGGLELSLRAHGVSRGRGLDAALDRLEHDDAAELFRSPCHDDAT